MARRSNNLIPRPRNAFFIYRSDMLKEASRVEHDARLLSRTLGESWKQMTPEQQAPWRAKAAAEKAQHLITYPEYRYTPRVRKDAPPPVKRNVSRNGPEDIDRCKKIAALLNANKTGDELLSAAQQLGPMPSRGPPPKKRRTRTKVATKPALALQTHLDTNTATPSSTSAHSSRTDSLPMSTTSAVSLDRGPFSTPTQTPSPFSDFYPFRSPLFPPTTIETHDEPSTLNLHAPLLPALSTEFPQFVNPGEEWASIVSAAELTAPPTLPNQQWDFVDGFSGMEIHPDHHHASPASNTYYLTSGLDIPASLQDIQYSIPEHPSAEADQPFQQFTQQPEVSVPEPDWINFSLPFTVEQSVQQNKFSAPLLNPQELDASHAYVNAWRMQVAAARTTTAQDYTAMAADPVQPVQHYQSSIPAQSFQPFQSTQAVQALQAVQPAQPPRPPQLAQIAQPCHQFIHPAQSIDVFQTYAAVHHDGLLGSQPAVSETDGKRESAHHDEFGAYELSGWQGWQHLA